MPQLELLLIPLIILGGYGLYEFLMWRERPPGGKKLFDWVLVPLFFVLFVALLLTTGDPTGIIFALILVGLLALVFATP
jgi:hypothetical protein